MHADSPAQADLAARRLRAVGFLELAGRLDAPETPERLAPVELDELERLLADGDGAGARRARAARARRRLHPRQPQHALPARARARHRRRRRPPGRDDLRDGRARRDRREHPRRRRRRRQARAPRRHERLERPRPLDDRVPPLRQLGDRLSAGRAHRAGEDSRTSPPASMLAQDAERREHLLQRRRAWARRTHPPRHPLLDWQRRRRPRQAAPGSASAHPQTRRHPPAGSGADTRHARGNRRAPAGGRLDARTARGRQTGWLAQPPAATPSATASTG